MSQLVLVILAAFLLDLVLGDPPYRFHPIRLIGLCISGLTKRWMRSGLGGKRAGILLVLIVQAVSVAGFLTADLIFRSIHPVISLGFSVFMAYSCLALKDLVAHTDRVTQALEQGDLAEARNRVAMVVGRDVQSLDEAGVSRAAVETLAENFVDGFLSPLFWYVMGGIFGFWFGLPPVISGIGLMLAFKAASTLDSMVGYKEGPFRTFGWAGARLDDVMNFVPARLSLGILFIGAWICRLDPVKGMKTALRDRLKHESPNSAHAESFVAGALGVRLGGATVYSGGRKEKPWLGAGNPDPSPMDIRRTARLLKYGAWATMAVPVSVLVLQ